jgi:hypothetical protein
LNICVEVEKEVMVHIREFKNLEIKTPFANRMNLLVQAPHEEESKEYFTLCHSPNCNEDGRLDCIVTR